MSEPDLIIEAGFSDAKLAQDVRAVVAKYKAAGEQAQKAFQDATGKVSSSQAAQAHMRELDRLKRAYDPVYTATKKYEAEVEKLNRALQVGAVTQQQYGERLRAVEKDLGRAAGLIQETGAGARKMGSGWQQAGFQIGDFAVQVGAGTSAAQAFAQQAPQLLGALGAYGAIAGAAVAVAVPLGAALFKLATDSKSLEDSLKDLASATDAYVDASNLAAMTIEEQRQKYGALADEMARVNETAAIIAQSAARAANAASVKKFATQFGGFSRADDGVVNVDQLFPQGSELDRTLVNLRAKFKLTQSDAEKLAAALEKLGTAKTAPDQLAALENLQSTAVGIAGTFEAAQTKFGDLLGDKGAGALIKALGEQAGAARTAAQRLFDEYAANTDKLTALQEKLTTAEAEYQKAVGEGNKNVADIWGRAIADLTEKLKDLRAEIAASDKAFADMARGATSIAQAYGDLGASRRAGEFIAGADRMAATKAVVKKYEGYAPVARWDENAARGGYGSSTVTLSDGTIQKLTKGQSVNPVDAERDLERRIGDYFEEQRRVMGQAWDGLTAQQVAALASVQHNYGSLPDRIKPALQTGDANLIAQALAGLAMDYTRSERTAGKPATGAKPMNYDRRMGEAAAFGSTTAAAEVAERELAATKENAAALKLETEERKRKAKAVEDARKALADNLISQQKAAEFEARRAAQVGAINQGPGTDAEKAAAIAQLNAAYERQVTVMALMEEAKRRDVKLDEQMLNSTMTYRQAIEALADAKAAQVIADQEATASADRLKQAQEFAAQQTQALKDGLVDAIVEGENFSDVLAGVAKSLAKAALQAALFGEGPMATLFGGKTTGSGLLGGLFSGLFGGARASGGPVTGGVPYLVGERGPEIIVPRSAGQVIPNHALGGSTFAPSNTIVINGDASERTVALIRQELAANNRQMERLMPAKINAVNRDPLRR